MPVYHCSLWEKSFFAGAGGFCIAIPQLSTGKTICLLVLAKCFNLDAILEGNYFNSSLITVTVANYYSLFLAVHLLITFSLLNRFRPF